LLAAALLVGCNHADKELEFLRNDPASSLVYTGARLTGETAVPFEKNSWYQPTQLPELTRSYDLGATEVTTAAVLDWYRQELLALGWSNGTDDLRPRINTSHFSRNACGRSPSPSLMGGAIHLAGAVNDGRAELTESERADTVSVSIENSGRCSGTATPGVPSPSATPS